MLRAAILIPLILAIADPCNCADGQQEPERTTVTLGTDVDTIPLEAQGVTELMTPRTRRQTSQRRQQLDPGRDGWDTEKFVGDAEVVLKQILNPFFQVGSIQDLQKLVTRDFGCAPLRPDNLRVAFRDSSVEVRRAALKSVRSTPVRYRGPSGLIQALQEFRGAHGDEAESKVQAKIYGMVAKGSMAATTVLVEVGGRSSQRVWQVRTKWDCLWQRTTDRPPRLSAIRVREYEEAHSRAQPGTTWFADCTQAALGENPAFHEQLAYGLDHWLQRIERAHRMHAFAATGLAVGDVNGDGLDDLYVCQPGGLPNRLFVQQPDGTALDYSVLGRVDWLDATSSALLVDLDNDGDQDLVLATLSGLVLMENSSTGRFRLVGVLPTAGADMQSLSAVDYDGDSDLDLYVCLNFTKALPETTESQAAFVYHNANDGAPNRLFRNEISSEAWKFADVTGPTGLDKDNRRHSLAAAWEDYDNDGDQDLYVANDYGPNCLYRNDGGHFVNIAQQADVLDFGSGMSVSWGDYNRDGLMDLYVGNMFSAAGSRVTSQQGFRPGADTSTRNRLRRFAKGNSLFENLGRGKFREVGGQKNVEIARWAWSSMLMDMNNSGAEDIFVANGYITTDDPGDL